ncbi:MAG: HlyC/CorC family transporter [Acidobacteria bacterium]|nr:HlyC/CorC family transporter [Acidobacteriota bacterium]
MIALNMELAVIVLSLLLLFFLSLIENAITQSSTLILRMMMERPDKPNLPLFPVVLEDKMQILVPLHFGTQVFAVTAAILITHRSILIWSTHGLIHSFILIVLLVAVFNLLLPRLLTLNEPEKKLAILLRIFSPFYAFLRSVTMPLSKVLSLFERLHEEIDEKSKSDNEEASGEEIQAYLEIGENEGILQEEDTKLIQSVVEFGNTLVREVMTPRTKIIACDETATIAELRETMIRYRHSRIPIYRGDMDHIIGIAYIRQLMAEYAKGRESDSIAGLVNPALFVPETKPVSKLLKELQERGDHAAIVIDEYGGVAGLVTIEDLVEEIVGEIRDEDEAKVSKIIEEGGRSYVLRGSTELSRLEDIATRKFENLSCATVAGLVMAYLGRVPARGESFDLNGLKIQILDADRKRVHWVRIQLPEIPGDEAQEKKGD